jgi:hypothetical protein
MSNDLETGILAQMERLRDSTHSVASVGVSCNVLEYALHANLHPGAAVDKHVLDVLLETVVRSGFDRDTNALGLALL